MRNQAMAVRSRTIGSRPPIAIRSTIVDNAIGTTIEDRTEKALAPLFLNEGRRGE